MQKETIVFRPARQADQIMVSEMMRSLYRYVGAADDFMTIDKTKATFQYLFSHQDNLRMEIFELNNDIVGYALLVEFWSNEYGGKVLQLDELFLEADFRSQGIASVYIRQLLKNPEYAAVILEVLPENKKAYRLYKHLGFEERETRTLYKRNQVG